MYQIVGRVSLKITGHASELSYKSYDAIFQVLYQFCYRRTDNHVRKDHLRSC